MRALPGSGPHRAGRAGPARGLATCATALLLAAGTPALAAQDTPPAAARHEPAPHTAPASATGAAQAPHAGTEDPGASATADPVTARTTTFDTIKVTAPRPQLVDPFAFDNPVKVAPNRFNRAWREPPSAEQIGMQGGAVALGIAWGLQKAGEAVTKLPRWKHQVRGADARPGPLDAAQLERAARLYQQAPSPAAHGDTSDGD